MINTDEDAIHRAPDLKTDHLKLYLCSSSEWTVYNVSLMGNFLSDTSG